MEKLHNWKARRSGGRITITHSTGRVANVDTIEPGPSGTVVAVDKNGRAYGLEM